MIAGFIFGMVGIVSGFAIFENAVRTEDCELARLAALLAGGGLLSAMLFTGLDMLK